MTEKDADEVAYIPGGRETTGGPLRRYLPPVPNGVGEAWLRARLPAGAWILDPFGASPRLAIEAARAGYRVLAAVNNPIARFLIDLHANPPSEEELRLALAELSAAQKSGERIEPHLRALYRTRCHSCGAEVEAQAFIWERGADAPAARIYACPNCKDSGERPANAYDAEQARRHAGGALHKARALERVAPLDDPDRVFVEEALNMYLPRAVYALFTLVNKLESFPAERRRGLNALLLAAFDACSTLWAYPATRARPRQLVTPPRFLERNVWLALEAAITDWPAALRAAPALPPAPLTTWPAQPPQAGGICLFDGRLRDLAGLMNAARRQTTTPAGSIPVDSEEETKHNSSKSPKDPGHPQTPAETIQIAAMLSVLPRPNQAFWTLSALWAGWLWGHEASAAFKSVLRRRRYDWDWHTAALHANLQHMAGLTQANLPVLALMAEAEPGFLSAALAAGASAHLELRGLALRADETQAQIHWEIRPAALTPPASSPSSASEPLAMLAQKAALEILALRAEPCAYLVLHTAILRAAVASGQWPAPQDGLENALAQINNAIEMALGARERFIRYGGGRTLDVGLWWAAGSGVKQPPASSLRTGAPSLPLADRVEMEAVRFLVKHPEAAVTAVDEAVCAAFPGLLTPEREMVERILGSYCQPAEDDLRRLRDEDSPAARSEDLRHMLALLLAAGKRLGFIVKSVPAPGGRQALRWIDSDNRQGYEFFVIASAVAGELLIGNVAKSDLRPVLALPGGRAALMEYKLQRDPRLQQALKAGWRLIKYRHLRRLAEDLDLKRDTLEARLGLDPLENHDPQMSLF